MVNACTSNVYGGAQYFVQHEILDGPESYDYTRCFIIYAHSAGTGYLNDLKFEIRAVLENNDLGTPKTEMSWRDKLRDLLSYPAMAALFDPATPLDFYLKRKSCILIRLMGDFWRFPKGPLGVVPAPVTTKEDFEGHYHKVGRHILKGGVVADAGPTDVYRCISFFSNSPCELEPPVKHPISLNVEMLVGQLVLPITIDPDIENKGGHP